MMTRKQAMILIKNEIDKGQTMQIGIPVKALWRYL